MRLTLQVEWILTELFHLSLNTLGSNRCDLSFCLTNNLLLLPYLPNLSRAMSPSPLALKVSQILFPLAWRPVGSTKQGDTEPKGVWGQGPPCYGDWAKSSSEEIWQPICPGAAPDCGHLIRPGNHPPNSVSSSKYRFLPTLLTLMSIVTWMVSSKGSWLPFTC
jgi:hypothetical protein